VLFFVARLSITQSAVAADVGFFSRVFQLMVLQVTHFVEHFTAHGALKNLVHVPSAFIQTHVRDVSKFFLNCARLTIYESLLMIYLENFFIGKVECLAFIDHNLSPELFVIGGEGLFLVQTFVHF
jgi:hypothetical protein